MTDYTVTIAGPERHDGQSPYTFVVSAGCEREAVETAMKRMAEACDHSRDFVVRGVEVGVPPPDAGYWWNDCRQP